MKKMKCSDLAGPESCEHELSAETFELIVEESKKHGKEMAEKGDEAHLEVMAAMKEKMAQPGAMEEWQVKMEAMKKQFAELPEASDSK